MNVTDEELSLLILWLFEGGNFYNNPNHLIGESGQEMSFTEAYREMKHLNEPGYFEKLADCLSKPLADYELPF